MQPRYLLRIEGLTVFLATTAAYVLLDGALWLYVAVILLPDISMIGYLHNTRLGSITYNAVHTYTVPAVAGGAAYWLDQRLLLFVSLIWMAHIGIDRAVRYGLKYPEAFDDTHLQRV